MSLTAASMDKVLIRSYRSQRVIIGLQATDGNRACTANCSVYASHVNVCLGHMSVDLP